MSPLPRGNTEQPGQPPIDLRLFELSLLEKVAYMAQRHTNSCIHGSWDWFNARLEAGQRLSAWAQAVDDYMAAIFPPFVETRGDVYWRPDRKGDKVS